MRQHSWSRLAYRFILALEWGAGGCLVLVIGPALKADTALWLERWEVAATALAWIQSVGWVAVPSLTMIIGAGRFIRLRIGEPWVWEAVRNLLSQFQVQAFDKEKTDPLHYHRVTLFRVKRWRWKWVRWPWSRCLVPIERSWHTTRRTDVVFMIPDAADRVQGVAGKTWASNRTIVITDLPDLIGNPVDDDFVRYAAETGVSVEWLRDKRPAARSFCGIPVEVKGDLWGVVVLDSRAKKGVGERPRKWYALVPRILGKLLERA